MTSEFYLSKPPSILDKVTTLPVFPCLEYTYLYSYNLPSIWANRRNNDVEKYSVLVCCNFVFILLLSHCSAFCQKAVCAVVLQSAGFLALVETIHFSTLLLQKVFFLVVVHATLLTLIALFLLVFTHTHSHSCFISILTFLVQISSKSP